MRLSEWRAASPSAAAACHGIVGAIHLDNYLNKYQTGAATLGHTDRNHDRLARRVKVQS